MLCLMARDQLFNYPSKFTVKILDRPGSCLNEEEEDQVSRFLLRKRRKSVWATLIARTVEISSAEGLSQWI